MKKWIIASALLMLVSVSTFAQRQSKGERPSPQERAKMMTERMANQLELTEAQKEQVMLINMEYAEKREAEMEARKKEMEARKIEAQEQEAKIQSVLTEEQRAKWTQLKDKRQNLRGRRPGGEIHDRGEFQRRRGGN